MLCTPSSMYLDSYSIHRHYPGLASPGYYGVIAHNIPYLNTLGVACPHYEAFVDDFGNLVRVEVEVQYD
jgi:hypothetical protein